MCINKNLFLSLVTFCSSEGNSNMIKSVERILSIWEDRDVYSGTLITDLRNTLAKEESPPETPMEQKSECRSHSLILLDLLSSLKVYSSILCLLGLC